VNPRVKLFWHGGRVGVILEEDHEHVPGRVKRAVYTVQRDPTGAVATTAKNPVNPVQWSPGETRTRWTQRRHLVKGVYWTNGRDRVWVRYNPLTTTYHYVIEGDKTRSRYGVLEEALCRAEE